jgi:hypothetical protein
MSGLPAPALPPSALAPRRHAVAARAGLSGLDRVEAALRPDGGVVLHLFFVPAHAPGTTALPPGLSPAHLRVSGAGAALRVTRVRATGPHTALALAVPQGPAPDPALRTTFTLAVAGLPGVDPALSRAPFSVSAGAGPEGAGAPPPAADAGAGEHAPQSDYLARDYATFRQLMLGRLGTTLPRWTERAEADVGMMLVEVLAFAADYLAYAQDAAGTEAYLSTARLRTSLRRHARLLDYAPGEGQASAAWVQLRVRAPLPVPAGTRLLSRVGSAPPCLVAGTAAHRAAMATGPAVFETLAPLAAHPALNQLELYDWGAPGYALPAGATHAALRAPGGAAPRPGDVLVLEEAHAPGGAPADPAHRQPVRLTAVAASRDPVSGAELLEVAWDPADAPAFALHPGAGGARALGNVVLAGEGMAVPPEALAPVRAGEPYRPRLALRCVTRTADGRAAQARAGPATAPGAGAGGALPDVEVVDGRGARWTARPDLLGSGPFSRDFVVESGDDGSAALRFGDGALGARPEPGEPLFARYRVGGGPQGNVGAGAVAHLVAPTPAGAGPFEAALAEVSNPLPAFGGRPPEALESIRRRAPYAFHAQERCIVPGDWAAVAARIPGVQAAAAELRWTGSWRTAFVHARRERGLPETAAWLEGVAARLEPRRPAGVGLRLLPPAWVPLEVELAVRVAPGALAAAVERALLAALGGGGGPFAPGARSFGEPVWLSAVVAAAAAVPGVASVAALRFRRMGAPGPAVLPTLEMAPTEIARLDADPGSPSNGTLRLRMEGAP